MSGDASQRYFADPALYDVIYAAITGDIPFHVELARHARGPVLEVACGNGRVLVPCVEAGADVDGIDTDPGMLDAARARLAARGLRAGLVRADMRDFTLPRRYELVAIPFSSFLHNLTQRDQLATLRCCREHLEQGGKLVLVMFSPDPKRLLENDGTARVSLEHASPAGTGTVRVWDAVTSDAVEQANHVERRVELLDAGGAVTSTHTMAFDLRWIWPAEMELLLLTAGFTRFAVEGRTSYDDGFRPKPKLEARDVMVWTAWKD
jgi:SAM-dependent methyltransferase